VDQPDLLGVDAALSAVLVDPSRAASLTPEHATALLVQLAAVQAALTARLQVAPRTIPQTEEREGGDRLMTAQEVAEVLHVPVSWIYRHSGQLPFAVKLSHKVLRFSERRLQAWMARQRH